jgi:ribosome-associated heat shock protein Hsp15
VEKGRVKIGGANVKPSKDVRVGDIVEIDIERLVWQVEVRGLCDVRGPATVAQTLYAETEEGRAKRMAEAERRKTFHEPAAGLQGRPTKRDRRTIDKFSRSD